MRQGPHTYRKIKLLRVATLAVGFVATLAACTDSTSKKKDSNDEEPGHSVVSSARTGSFTPYSDPGATVVEATYVPPDDIMVSLWKSRVTFPGGTTNQEAKLTLKMIQGGLVAMTSSFVPVSPYLTFQAVALDGAALERTTLRRNIKVECIVDRTIKEKDIIVVMKVDPGVAAEVKYGIAAEDLTFTKAEDGTTHIAFETRDTFFGFAVVAAPGGVLPAGFARYPALPHDATEMTAKPDDVTDEPAQVALKWLPPELSTVGYKFAVAYDGDEPGKFCESGALIDSGAITSVRTNFPMKVHSDAYTATGLSDGKAVIMRICSVNGRVPPDISEGTTIAYDLPDRAKATLAGSPPLFTNATALGITIAGDGVTSYRYDLMETAGASCADAEYGEWTDIGTLITDALTTGEKLLCVLGRKSETNEQVEATKFAFTVDVTPPPAFDLEAFVSPVNVAAPSFTWAAAEDNANYTLKLASDDQCTTSVQTLPETKELTATPTALTDGTYYVCVYAADRAGNVTAATSNGIEVTIDLTPPVFTSIALANEAANGYLNLAERSVQNDVADTLVASGHTSVKYAAIAAGVTCDANVDTATAMPQNDALTFSTDGNFKICVRLADDATNLTFGTSATFTVDTGVPTFTSVARGDDAADGYISAADHLLSTPLAKTLVSSGQDTTGYVLVANATTCDGLLTYGASIPAGTSTDFTVNDVAYKVCLKLSDLAGNPTVYGATSSFIFDATVPAFVSFARGDDVVDGYLNLAERAVGTDLAKSLVATGQQHIGYALTLGGTSCNAALTYGASIPQNTDAGVGAEQSANKVCVKLTDDAGNPPAYGETATWVFDSVVPAFTSIDLGTDVVDGFLNAADHALLNPLATNLAGTGYSAATYALAAGAADCTLAAYGVMPLDSSVAFGANDTAHKVCVKLADPAGNPPAYGETTTFIYDITVPTFTTLARGDDVADGYLNAAERVLPTNLAKSLVASGQTHSRYALVSDNTTCDALVTYVASIPMNDDVLMGAEQSSNKVCVELTDDAGNPADYGETGSFVLDTVAPSFVDLFLGDDNGNGFLNAAEHLLTNDLAKNLDAPGADIFTYALVDVAVVCNGSVTYGVAIPKDNDAGLSGEGTVWKVCVKLADLAANPVAYGETATFEFDADGPAFTSLANGLDVADGYLNIADSGGNTDLGRLLSASHYDSAAYALVDGGVTCDGLLAYDVMPQDNDPAMGGHGTTNKVCVQLSDNAGNPTVYGATPGFVVDLTTPAFTSIALHASVDAGYLNAAEHALTTDLAGAAVGSGYDTATYGLAAAAQACDNTVTYGAMPKFDDTGFSGEGTSWKVCVKLADAAANPPVYDGTSTFTFDADIPAFTSLANGLDVADGYLSVADAAGTTDLARTLVASHYDTAAYALTLSATACTSGLTFGGMPQNNDGGIGVDGSSNKVCVRLTDTAGNAAAYGASAGFVRDTTAPSFTSLARGASVADGYLNIADIAGTSDLAQTLVASGYDTADYGLVLTAVTCDGSVTYGAMPKNNDGSMGADGSVNKVCVRLRDNAGNTTAYGSTSTFTRDTTAPAVASTASATSNGSYNATDEIVLTVTTSENVTRAGGADTDVTLVLETGTTDHTATLTGVGSPFLTFTYTVQSGDTSADLNTHAVTHSIVLAGAATLNDVAGNPMNLDLTQGSLLSANSDIVIDTTAPTAFAFVGPGAGATVNDNTPTISWGASAGADTYDVLIDDTTACASPLHTYNDVVTTSVDATILGDDAYFLCITAKDIAGNQTTITGDNRTFTVATGTWSAMAASGLLAREGATVALDSVGGKAYVWGGADGAGRFADGAAYNTGNNTWAAIDGADIHAATARVEHTATWTGTKMVVWGGKDAAVTDTGGVFEPGNAGDYWTVTNPSGAPDARRLHTAVWDGTNVIVWGGRAGAAMQSGGLYNVAGDSWTATDETDALDLPTARYGHTAVWTGTTMIVWGGIDGGGRTNTGAIYDPAGPGGDFWTPITTTGAPTARDGHTAIWTGSVMIVFGGYDGTHALATGAIFDPTGGGSWTPLSATEPPLARKGHTAVFDSVGNRMIVWGGLDDNGNATATGGILDTVGNSWTTPATNAGGAISARSGHAAVWDGTKMDVFFGFDGVDRMDDGGRYTPQ